MKKTMTGWLLAGIGSMALLLTGCSGQSVTYDPGAAAPTEAPVFSETVTEEPTVTSAPPAIIETESVTELPTETPPPTETPTPTPTAIAPIEVTATPDPDAGLKLIGEKTESETLVRAKLTNLTGLTLTWFSIKDSFTDNFPADFLDEKDAVLNNESRVLYYDYAHAAKESAEREERASYDIRVELKTREQQETDREGRYLVLHDVPFSDFEEARICYDEGDGILYLTYKSKTTGAEVSTAEAELSRKEAAARTEDEDEDDGGSRTDNGADAEEENPYVQEEESYDEWEDEDEGYTPIEDEGDDYVDYGFDDEDVIYYDDDYEEYDEVVG